MVKLGKRRRAGFSNLHFVGLAIYRHGLMFRISIRSDWLFARAFYE